MGFLNPFIYENPSIFNDVTTGNNPGCDTDGFYAANGWDPITGNAKMLEAALALP
jgi:tripeptidyl-peptidase-1